MITYIMFTWFTDLSIDEDQAYPEEPPETPAPLFAVRAFKTALFGTPAPSLYEKHEKMQSEQTKMSGVGGYQKDGLLQATAKSDPKTNTTTKLRVDSFVSPAKGILLTPGTGTTRRKTVSFGTIAKGLEQQPEPSQVLDASDKARSSESEALVPATFRTAQSDQFRETSLNKKLFKSRDDGLRAEVNKPDTLESVSPEMFFTEPQSMKSTNNRVVGGAEGESELTVDLKDPRSRSGQHWKREYSRYHEKSDREMRKLIRHSQIAKSHAIRRDNEATNLREKLEKSLERVADMEAKVADLAVQLANGGTHEKDGLSSQEDLMSQLATQTAQALRYKYKVEKYELAIREQGLKSGTADHEFPGVKEKLDEEPMKVANTLPVQDLHAERESLRSEVVSLRNIAKSAEEKAAQLTVENTTFRNTIRRVKEEMKNYEVRHKASEERRKQRDHNHKVQKRTLEVNLAQCKTELDTHMNKHHEEMAELTREKDRLEAKLNEAVPGVTLHEGLVEDLRRQIRDLKDEVSSLRPDLLQNQQRKMSQELRQAREELQKTLLENIELKREVKGAHVGDPISMGHVESQQHPIEQSSSIDVWTDMTGCKVTGVGGPRKALSPRVYGIQKINNQGDYKYQQPVLTEINFNNLDQRQLYRTGSKDNVSIPVKNHDALSPLAPSSAAVAAISNQLRNNRQTSIPSLIPFQASPPPPKSSSYIQSRHRQPSLISGAGSREASRSKKPSDPPAVNTGSNRVGSMSAGERKSSLPPDRLAAAKLRLEQKSKEKGKVRSRIGMEDMKV